MESPARYRCRKNTSARRGAPENAVAADEPMTTRAEVAALRRIPPPASDFWQGGKRYALPCAESRRAVPAPGKNSASAQRMRGGHGRSSGNHFAFS